MFFLSRQKTSMIAISLITINVGTINHYLADDDDLYSTDSGHILRRNNTDYSVVKRSSVPNK